MTKIDELVATVRAQAPGAMAGIQDRAAARLLREAFATVARELQAAGEGVHRIPGLGVFRVRALEPNADGTGGGTRIVYRPAKPSAGKGATGG